MQVDLLAEHELTRTMALVKAIATKLGVEHLDETRGLSNI